MEEIKFIISSDEAGARIDKCIAIGLGEEYSRSYVKFLMDNGFVQVNGGKVKPNYTAREDDTVTVVIPPAQEMDDVEPEDIPLNIVYEDEWLIVIDKIPGMVVHPAAGNRTGTIVNALLHHCGKLPDTDNRVRPGIVHRLDKDTSGIMVVARNDKAMRSLAKQFQNRTIKKRYIALVKGFVELDNGVIEAPVARNRADRKKMNVEYTNGKKARTVYHVVRRYKGFTFLRLEPETGRTHQIRVHMKHLGHPILGDVTYGGCNMMARQALHAEMLGFTHPGTGTYAEFTSPMPDDMKEVIEKNG